MAITKPGLTQTGSLITDNLGGPGQIQFDPTSLTSASAKKNEIIDYIRLRLADQIVDEIGRAHV